MNSERRNDNYAHILKYAGLFGGVQGLAILIGIIRNKLVALILGAEGMGLMALFNSTIRLLSDATSFGLSMSAVKQLSECYEKGDNDGMQHRIDVIRLWSGLTSLFGMAVCVILSPQLSRWVFDWGDHSLHFVLLSVIVGMTAITGGELAILKGTRRLAPLAKISILHVVGALVTSIPLYYIWGYAAIIPSLIVIALIQMALTLYYSHRLHGVRYRINLRLLSDGAGMMRLGMAFMLAITFGSAADLLIRRYLNVAGSVETVGLYNAGYMMMMTYGGVVFSSLEADYFPRLSAITEHGAKMSKVVNNQIEVSLLLIAPLLVFFLMTTPFLLSLFYSNEFVVLSGMVQLMALAMYMRAVKLPIAYIPLAKGNSRLYLLMEGIYYVVFVAAVIYGYNMWGLTGTGIGIVFTAVFDFFLLLYSMNRCYQYVISTSVIKYIALQLPVGLLAFAFANLQHSWIHWPAGILLSMLSLWISVYILRKKTNLWQRLKSKFLRR